MDTIAQVIHECETCAAVKQAKRVKFQWYEGRWLKYKYGEAWQIDYITLPQTCQGKRYVLCATWRPQPIGWKPTLCLMPLPRIPPWALKGKTYVDMAPPKELSRTTGLIVITTL